MLTQAETRLPILSTLPAAVLIRGIELFVIPETEMNADGYRVCLRTTCSIGCGSSELFIHQADKPIDWTRWSGSLLRFIGILSLSALSALANDLTIKDARVYQLLLSSIQHLPTSPSFICSVDDETEHLNLLNRSISYVSLF